MSESIEFFVRGDGRVVLRSGWLEGRLQQQHVTRSFWSVGGRSRLLVDWKAGPSPFTRRSTAPLPFLPPLPTALLQFPAVAQSARQDPHSPGRAQRQQICILALIFISTIVPAPAYRSPLLLHTHTQLPSSDSQHCSSPPRIPALPF